ncbi:unnamed protein product [Anisakis simplex]|uniref:Col_cuticle_N domain-containing protein n=1 Tax=Anisakis simplex TaxID=6269 RepID=A0A0M3KJY9_ANISI|nr:unnamed protein product [Anisakis simplex]
MKFYTATFIASSASGVALLACLVAVLYVYNDVQSIWMQIDAEMNAFRATTDDLWHDMMRLGANRSRFRRQGGYGSGSLSSGGKAAEHGHESSFDAEPTSSDGSSSSHLDSLGPIGPEGRPGFDYGGGSGGDASTGEDGSGSGSGNDGERLKGFAPGTPPGALPPGVPPSIAGGPNLEHEGVQGNCGRLLVFINE